MKKLIYLIILISFANILKSQTELLKSISSTPNIVTPEVYNLGLYGNYPVDYSTGVPQINIPIYTIKSGSLSLPISFSYHASGIKVQQESSSVGLGWVLNAGGMITRQVRDIPDDGDELGFISSGNKIPVINNISDNNLPNLTVSSYGNNALLKSFYGTLTPMGGGNEWHNDKYPDIFSIITNMNLSGEFSYNNNGEIVSTFVDKQKITCDFVKNKISIIDIDGTQYIFGRNDNGGEAFDLYDDQKEISYDVNEGEDSATPLRKIPHSKSWYLAEVISRDGKNKITFIYDETVTYSKDLISESKGWPIGLDHLTTFVKVPYTKSFLSTGAVKSRILKKIVFNEGWVEFVLIKDRQDRTGIPRTSEIKIYSNTGLLKQIILDNNNYFNRTGYSYSISNLKDLKLNNVKFLDSKGLEDFKYSFEYNESVSLPERKSMAIDFWGYYNGKENISLIPDQTADVVTNSFVLDASRFNNSKRETNFDYMKAFSLKKIIFPTKGYSVYEYEPNYFLKSNQQNGLKLVDKSEILYAIDNAFLCREKEYFAGITSSVKKDIYFDNVVDNVVDITVFFSDYQITNGQSMYAKITGLPDYPMGLLISHDPQDMYNFKAVQKKLYVTSGSKISVEINTNQVKGNSQYGPCGNPYISFSIGYKSAEKSSGLDEILPTQAGGLRIKKINNFDSSGELVTSKRYEYGTKVKNNIGVGEIITNPYDVETYFQKIWPVIVCNPQSSPYYSTHNVFIITSNPVLELGLNNGNPVFYRSVSEYFEDYKSNNKLRTDYFYEKQENDIISSGDIYLNSPTVINPSWKKSYLSKKITYKGNINYLPVKKEEYNYINSQEQRIRTLNIREIGPETASINFNSSSCIPVFYVGDFKNRFKFFNDYTSIGRRSLSDKKVTNYFYTNNKTDSITVYSKLFYTNTDNNQLSKERISFSNGTVQTTTYSYAHEKNNQYLIDKNIIGIPLQTVTTKTENAVTTTISNTDTKYPTSQTEATNKTNGLPLPIAIVSKTIDDNPTDITEITYDQYDERGNLLQYTTKSGVPTAIIYGYNGTLPIAKIEGATYAQVQTLATAIITASDLDASDPTKESDFITTLDQFRSNSALSNFQITTYTYDPIIGVTSITPPSGIREIYKYDTANRLEKVIDVNNNVLKEYNYNYKR